MALSRTEAQRLAATDTSQVDQAQLAKIHAGLRAAIDAMPRQVISHDEWQANAPGASLQDLNRAGIDVERAEHGDPEWAGPSLPHPTEATSPEEADELRQGWDDWQHVIEPNTEEAAL